MRMKVSLFVAVFVCVAACVLADDTAADHQKCLPLQKLKVRRQWSKAFGEGSHRIKFAQQLYRNLFKAYPKARNLHAKFRGDNIYSPEFLAFSQRLLGSLTIVIDTTDDPAANKVLVGKLKDRLTAIGVTPEFYTAFRDNLFETLPDYLGTHFDWDAWTGCFNGLIDALTH